jgi:exodeoxyribonuclease VII large subunit
MSAPVGPHVFAVKEITRYVKTLLERERALQGVLVRGEISNCRYHTSGHLYFTLKDDLSELKCVMWRDRVLSLPFRAEDGLRVIAEGSIVVYERGGYYQLNAYALQDDGVGNLFLAFEQLKRKLEAEGLFDPARKRPLPAVPRRIALITSPTGAVVHDFLTVTERRWRGRRLLLIPAAVQGPTAAPGLVHALALAAGQPEVDLIVLARGGGSFEDLACFNDEALARAIAASPVPVVSAVGHETDVTIADFVADLRAPTPSAAAELTVPDSAGVLAYIDRLFDRVIAITRARIELRRRDLARLQQIHPAFRGSRSFLNERRQAVDLAWERIGDRQRARITAAKARFLAVSGRLAALDPRGVLARGYALVTRPADGALLPTAAAARAEHEVDMQFSDGTLRATL